jgi:hypothetical protein
MKSIGKNTINTFHGNALVILRPFEKNGKITVKASSQGLKEGSISVSVED